MSTTMTIEVAVHFQPLGRCGRKTLGSQEQPAALPAGRVPRVARLLALAIRFEELIRSGQVANGSVLASLGQVTRARISQILSLLHLATDIQEELLFLPLTTRGRDPILLADVLPIAACTDWRKQRRLWRKLQPV